MDSTQQQQVLMAIFGNEEAVKSYLGYVKFYGISEANMMKIENLSSFWDKWRSQQQKPTSVITRNSSIIMKTLKCGWHEGPEFKTPSIKMGTQKWESNEFEIQFTKGAVTGRDPVDNLLVDMIVCPQCGYASFYSWHFISREPDQDGYSFNSHIAPTDRQKTAVNGFRAVRRIKMGGAALWASDRTFEDALTSYELGVLSVQNLFEASPDRYSGQISLVPEYLLRAAQLCRSKNDPREDEYLKRTFVSLKNEGITNSKTVMQRMRNMMRLFRLSIRYDDESAATRCVSDFVKYLVEERRTKSMSEKEFHTLENYTNVTREDLRSWKDQKAGKTEA